MSRARNDRTPLEHPARRASKDASAMTISAEATGLAMLLMVGGCSLIADTDRTQCEKPADCAAALGGAESAYACESNLCQSVVECMSSAECTGNERFCSEVGACVECLADADCGSATAVCMANVCVDETWGCLNKPDQRMAATQSQATLTFKTTNPLTRMPLPTLTVRACLDHIADPTCSVAHPQATTEYTPATGDVKVTMPQDNVLHLKLDAPQGIQSVDIFSNRPPRDMQDLGEFNFIPANFLSSLGGGMAMIDPAKPTALLRVFNCKGEPAAGVSMEMKDKPSDVVTAYIEGAGPRFDLQATSAAGRAGFFNLPSGVRVLLTARISATQAISFELVPGAGRSHQIDLYPGVYVAK